ncbi:valine--tRNA ligase [Aurantimonas sp. C2-6-R+9]|uniref:valine--tRNA ligase n=1 Tax=unclassified Aurantimonas TaxID=2638230 RepID=UPI002E190B6E|nr:MULTISPECIES: valine--tRNA ligase [unclassified Aurantimonas]MEC5289839.1 valine--tRNA ligase [Aurantimonas sp. C2-3-R2]MEC5380020.1 valine--tRNA ligase [Aurantimonas sp. C2-6-R+9]MEC5410921.1 valine--tRNA ligase [Aurantimonas sp. C2-4-R8]
MIEKTYDAAAIEPRIAERWEKADAFRAGAGAAEGAEAYSIVIPPPNVTGSLHMGHALNDTLQDILIRFERMRGKNVLWQPGLDHAGIATQMVVERQLAERKEPGRRDMGRDAFIDRVWQWKGESGGTILEQLRRLGASCDWSRERFTMDEGLSKAVLYVFVELYRKGLIYKDKRLVNWDPKLLTAISDLEVEQKEVASHLWHFRYPLADGVSYEHPYNLDDEGNRVAWKPSDGEPAGHETRDYLVVATTRPETMLGDTGVAVHPDDPRYKDLVGKHVILPLVGRRVPIVADEYPDPEAGTGAVKMTPAHDFNDFEVGKRHDLQQISILTVAAAITLAENPDFLDGVEPSDDLDRTVAELDGKDRFAARDMVVTMMEERGYLDRVENHAHTVPHGDRGGVPIEPFLTDQWYVDAKTLAEPAIASVREGRTKFVPKNWEKTYFDWMENIQPWCISRQLWWGHQIPAWYGPDGEIFVEKSEEEAVAAALAHYVMNGTISDDEAKAMAADPARRDGFLHRDEDVLDTWFSSALWPFSTLGWPEKTPELATYYPTSVLVTGFDIIFFWVARMMMMGLEFMDEEPFHTVYVHALVRDKTGAKMSKSKGNVVDPLDLIDEYGADALRFTLAIMAAQGRDVKLDPQRIAGYRNFGTKLWNATRFAEMNGALHGAALNPAPLTLPLNRWIVTELGRTIAETEAAIGAYRFNDAAATLYRFVWNLFCDWYVELAKPTLGGSDEAAANETRIVMGSVLDRIYALLHPFMPFMTEELWATTAETRPSLLCHAAWPSLDFADSNAADDINWLIAVVSEIRSVRAEMNVPPGAQAALLAIAPDASTAARLDRHGTALKRLARLASIETSDGAPDQSAQIIAGGATFALPLAGMIDIAAERSRLEKAEVKALAEIERIDRKLSNQKFVANAPEEVVEQEREKREAYRLEAEKLAAGLERLR